MQSVTRDTEPTFDREGRLILQGYDLRYVLTTILAGQSCELMVADLAEHLAGCGFATRGRPSKVISDALRSEVGMGRVRRTGRGLYRIDVVPKVTLWRIRRHVLELQALVRSALLRQPEPGHTGESGHAA